MTSPATEKRWMEIRNVAIEAANKANLEFARKCAKNPDLITSQADFRKLKRAFLNQLNLNMWKIFRKNTFNLTS